MDGIPHRKMISVMLSISQKLFIYLFLRPWCCAVTRLTSDSLCYERDHFAWIIVEAHWPWFWFLYRRNSTAHTWCLTDENKLPSFREHKEIRRCCYMWIYEYSTDVTDNLILKIPVFRWCCRPKIHTGSSVSGNSSK